MEKIVCVCKDFINETELKKSAINCYSYLYKELINIDTEGKR